MKIGISALLFNLEECINICKQVGAINHIELGIDNLEECKLLHKYKHVFKELGVSLSIHLPMELNTCENINFIRKSWIEFILKINEELKEFDIKYFNLHLGYVISNRLKKNRDKYLQISVEFLEEIGDKINTPISIENVYSNEGDLINIGNIVYDFEYIFNKIKHNKLWFCYDTGHNLINSDEYINKLGNEIKVIHLSDNDGKDDIHIGLGKGILSKNHIKELLELNTEYMILEINYNDVEESVKILESIIEEV